MAAVKTEERVYQLDLHGSRLTETEGLQKYKHLRILDLSCNGLCRIEGLDGNSSLQELKLYGNEIEEVSGLEKLTDLRNLMLQHNKIRAIGQGLAALRKLKVLRVDHNLLLQVTPSELAACSRLTHVDLSHNQLRCVEGLGALHELEELKLASNQLSHLPDLARCCKLQVLSISYNPLCLLSLVKLPHSGLKELWAEGLQLTDLTALPLLRCMQELHIAHNQLASLQGLCTVCPSLEQLDIRNNLLASTTDLQPLTKLSSLTDLLVEGNPLCRHQSYQKDVRRILPGLEVIDTVASEGGSATPLKPVAVSRSGPSMQQMEQQLREMEIELESCQKEIRSRFDDLQNNEDISPCQADTLHSTTILKGSRPASHCGSRARLQDALTFAKEHFNS